MRQPGERSTIIHSEAAADLRLEKLGIPDQVLIDAAHAYAIERSSCSALEPTIAPAFKAWAAAVRTLGEGLIPKGPWKKIETRNLPRWVNKESAIAVTACTGDENTGNESVNPRSKNPRGSEAMLLVHTNNRQGVLFDQNEFIPIPPDREQFTWWLLIYLGETELRAELSLPIGLGESRHFSHWEERILLDVPGPERIETGKDSDEDDDSLDIRVEVSPRG